MYVYSCVMCCVGVCTYTDGCATTHVDKDVGCPSQLLPTLSFEKGSLTDPGAP